MTISNAWYKTDKIKLVDTSFFIYFSDSAGIHNIAKPKE